MVGIKLTKVEKADSRCTKKNQFPESGKHAGKALYIDDDYVNYLFFKELLSETDCRIYSATTLNQAFQTMILQKDISMVVISDLFLSEENRILLHLFRKSFPGIPMILMVCREAISEGKYSDLDFDLYVNRQTDVEHLLESISELN